MKIQVNAVGLDQPVDVIACDVDKAIPALTYTITVSDGRSISKDLCEEHGGYLEDLLEELEVRDSEPEPGPAKAVAAKATPAKKAPAKKAAPKEAAAPAKKTPSRRRPRITSLEEIEAAKKS
ncbi:hypothetical protein [Streptomyces sp. NPDC060187]|uniref:hypothetical protein n=1 Tax=Streptomyces sp. NPDC060187 TaxID=3347067 RepID=UPI0036620E76